MPLTKARYSPVLTAIFSILGCWMPVKGDAQPVVKPANPPQAIPADPVRPAKDSSRTDLFLEQLLQRYPQYFDTVLANRKAYNVQVIYTTVDRGANGIAALRHYYFNVNAGHYFYPGTAAALPLAILSLQKLEELKLNGIDQHSTMLTETAYPGQTAVYNDPTTPDGKPCIDQYLKRMLIGGDETAVNRLYEFTGQQYLNDQLRQKGYPAACIVERLGTVAGTEENRHTNPISFVGPGNKLLYRQPPQYNSTNPVSTTDSLGRAYYTGEEILPRAMSFSGRNHISLEDLHSILVSLVFPNKVTAAQRFAVTEEDKKYLMKYLGQLPSETVSPPYRDDSLQYFPACNKYLLYGAEPGPLLPNVRIFNKAGAGYGNLTDVAYITDTDKKIEFFLSAVIYCNSDGILDDDHYEYETMGLPFMKHLGRVIYEYELGREKKNLPDLKEIMFDYQQR